MADEAEEQRFDVFLSHSHHDAVWVEKLASRLADEHEFLVWLDRWNLIPGKPWQQEMASTVRKRVRLSRHPARDSADLDRVPACAENLDIARSRAASTRRSRL
jgi:hypothetical protein